ncbi:hypothetical protein [uncultured Sphingomonas sp.]|uniref:hypothetical protein n=1 Tax=uncultured Sphingomonas sp. TaxID=158754 RepID=UPI0035C964F5
MRLSLFLLAAQAAAPAASLPVAFDLAAVRPDPLSTSTSQCGRQAGETDVVVCGRHEHYRLPLPV